MKSPYDKKEMDVIPLEPAKGATSYDTFPLLEALGQSEVPQPISSSVNATATQAKPQTPPTEIKLSLELPPTEDIVVSRVSAFSIIQSLVEKSWFIILVGLIFFAVTFAIVLGLESRSLPHSGNSTALIMYGFAGAEYGLDPLGNPLTPQDLRSPGVVNLALDSLNLRDFGISPDLIRANLMIQAVNPHEGLSRIQALQAFLPQGERLMELLDEVAFHPTQFILSLTRTAELEQLSDQEMNILLQEIINHYSHLFVQGSHELTFLDVVAAHIDPEEHDFLIMTNILNLTLHNMEGHVSLLEAVSPDFRSTVTTRTFGDFLSHLEILRFSHFNRIASTISVHNLSRDAATTADMLEFELREMILHEQVLRRDAEAALMIATEVYNPQTWIFGTENHVHEFHRNDSLYTELLANARDAIFRANRLVADIESTQLNIRNLRYEDSSASAEIVAEVESWIVELFDILRELEYEINLTIQDFISNSLFLDAVRVLSPPAFGSVPSVNHTTVLLTSFIAAVVGVILGILLVLYRHIFKESKSLEA